MQKIKMKKEKLKGRYKKIFLYGVSLLVVLIYIGYLLAFNNYSKKIEKNDTKEIKRSMAIYLQGEDGNYKFSKSIPKKEDGLVLDEKKSMCEGNTKVSWNYKDWRLVLKDIDSNNLKCYLYFRETNAKEQILANKTISERTDFSTVLTTDTTGTIFKAEDNDGTSYYFAGKTNENWVKFAGFYWRIIRVNGDGTIRLIYSGDETSGPVTTGDASQIRTGKFNAIYDNNMYVGYMYESEVLHGLITKSTIMEVVEDWYKMNIVDKKFDKYVDENAGFCGDRGLASGTGLGTTGSSYAAYGRLITNKTPTLKCGVNNNNLDLYTKGIGKGNGKLGQPVGLITVDEVAYAGARYGSTYNNSAYYLYTGEVYWTLSPYSFNGLARMFAVGVTGDIVYYGVNGTIGIRPTINLRADTIFTSGNGSSSMPFTVN